jgi:hypothetical protein
MPRKGADYAVKKIMSPLKLVISGFFISMEEVE